MSKPINTPVPLLPELGPAPIHKPPSVPSTPVKPTLPVRTPAYDSYGCDATSGYHYSPGTGLCCRQRTCKNPEPWTCQMGYIPQDHYSDWYGCKHPGETYHMASKLCCNEECVKPVIH
jgi:hypothetical protein